MVLDVADRARQRAERGPWLQRVARTGLLARAALHFVVGFLAVRVAFGDHRHDADHEGALEAVTASPMGRLLVVLLALGFAGYAVWRAVQALLDPENRGDGAAGVVLRLTFAGRALIYASLCALAVSLAVGRGGSGPDTKRELTARLLGLPFGWQLVAAIGTAVLGIGAYNAWKGLAGRYADELKQYEIDAAHRRFVSAVAVTGYLARGAVYGLVGVFLVRAAVRFDPTEPTGLDEALKRLAERPAGPWLLVMVGVGLVAHGVYGLVLARYKRVLDS